MNLLDLALVLLATLAGLACFAFAHWLHWAERGGEVFWMLNGLLFVALAWRIAYRRGWDG